MNEHSDHRDLHDIFYVRDLSALTQRTDGQAMTAFAV